MDDGFQVTDMVGHIIHDLWLSRVRPYLLLARYTPKLHNCVCQDHPSPEKDLKSKMSLLSSDSCERSFRIVTKKLLIDLLLCFVLLNCGTIRWPNFPGSNIHRILLPVISVYVDFILHISHLTVAVH